MISTVAAVTVTLPELATVMPAGPSATESPAPVSIVMVGAAESSIRMTAPDRVRMVVRSA